MNTNIKIENGYYLWDKNEILWINNWFKTSEFSCKCSNEDCKEQRIAVELVNRLTEMREYVDSPLRVHSGYRCSKHQAAIRASGVSTVVATKSTHEKGDAADISFSSLTSLLLLPIAAIKFKSIGIASNFLHLDLRDDKERRWNY